MTATTHRTTGPTPLRALAMIEATRFARHPAFIVSSLFTLGVTLSFALTAKHGVGDLLSWTVVPAFFTGLPSVIIAARLTRSASAADEALGIAPESEATRTKALLLACLVPFSLGVAWLVETFVLIAIKGHFSGEWWFGTVPAKDVIAIMVGGGPIACLGGALFGVMLGRWVRFPGAPAVGMIGLMLGTLVIGGMFQNAFHLPTVHLAPFNSWQGGTESDGTAQYYPGSPAWCLLYELCLCATAAIAAVWHDHTARSSGLRKAIPVVSVVMVSAAVLTAVTGPRHTQVSPPNPIKISHS